MPLLGLASKASHIALQPCHFLLLQPQKPFLSPLFEKSYLGVLLNPRRPMV